MGISFSCIKKRKKKKPLLTTSQSLNKIHSKYDDDLEDAVNLVLAMQQDRNSINIELSFACTELPNADMFSKSDPMIVVYIKNINSKKNNLNFSSKTKKKKSLKNDYEILGKENYKIVGMTEAKVDSLNPIFDKKIIVSFNSKISQKLKFEIYDIDDFENCSDLKKQELLGYIETDFSEIVYKDIWEGVLKSDNRRFRSGKIKVRGIESDIGQSKIWFTLEIHDFLTKNNIYFTISGANALNQYFKIYKSRPTKNKIRGWYFEPFRINSNQINNDSDNLKFEFFELRKDKISRFLGELDITLKGMFNNVNQDIDIYKNNLIVGKLKITNVTKDDNANFFSYVYADFCLKTILAVDLSISKKTEKKLDSENKDFLDIVEKLEIKQPCNGSEKKIEYYKDPIDKISSVLKNFDDDSQIPVFGFGAKLPPTHTITSNCFALTEKFYSPFFPNSKSVISTLEEKVIKNKNFILNGPTFFSEIVKFGKEFAKYIKIHESKYYVVMVIITDSILKDKKKFEEELKKCSSLPISIIICNSFNFDKINNLAENKLKEEYNKKKEIYEQIEMNLRNSGSRDILHWFKCSKYKESLSSMTKNVLAKIPKQFVEYMESEGKKPKRTEGGGNNKKGKGLKKELMDKLEIRKNKNSQKNLMKKFLGEKKILFLKGLEDIGYEKDILDILKGDKINIPCEDINLICQIVEQLKNIEEKNNKKPIPIENLKEKIKTNEKFLTKKSKILFEKNNFENIVKKKDKKKKNNYINKIEEKKINFIKKNFSNYF